MLTLSADRIKRDGSAATSADGWRETGEFVVIEGGGLIYLSTIRRTSVLCAAAYNGHAPR